MRYLALLFLIFSLEIDAKLEDHFKPAPNKSPIQKMKGIDFIYMINLDQRPEKFEKTCQQLAVWGIEPYRFSAVNGWELSLETVTDVGVKYHLGMSRGILGTFYEAEQWKNATHEPISKEGRTYFCHCMSLGAIGIALSHLSILQDAYDSGYETIWVMEDDIEIIRSPHLLSDLIQHLDKKVGKDKWDVLFTDRDTKNQNGQYVPCSGYALRPNFSPSNKRRFARRTKICSHFEKIGARYGAYSMIVRRSGMKKILDFLKKYSIFLPYDMEFYLPNDVNFFAVSEDIISTIPLSPSDNGGPNYKNKLTE